MIVIELPLNNQQEERYTPVVRAYLIPDMAPHLPGTYAVHIDPWRNEAYGEKRWIVSNVECGACINKAVVGGDSLAAAIDSGKGISRKENARRLLEGHTQTTGLGEAAMIDFWNYVLHLMAFIGIFAGFWVLSHVSVPKLEPDWDAWQQHDKANP